MPQCPYYLGVRIKPFFYRKKYELFVGTNTHSTGSTVSLFDQVVG